MTVSVLSQDLVSFKPLQECDFWSYDHDEGMQSIVKRFRILCITSSWSCDQNSHFCESLKLTKVSYENLIVRPELVAWGHVSFWIKVWVFHNKQCCMFCAMQPKLLILMPMMCIFFKMLMQFLCKTILLVFIGNL